MKKIFTTVLFLAVFLTAKINERGGLSSWSATNIGVADSVKSDTIALWGEYLAGYSTLTFTIRNKHGNTKMKFYVEYSNDGSRWFNRTILDSVNSAGGDSAMIDFSYYQKSSAYLRFLWKGFGAAGDTATVLWDWNKIPLRSIAR